MFSHLHAGAGSDQLWLQTVGLYPSVPRSLAVSARGVQRHPWWRKMCHRNPRVGNKIKKSDGAKVKFDQLIIRKIIKIVATRCHILRLKSIKFNFGWSSAPDPAGGAHSAPLDHFVVSKNSAASDWLISCSVAHTSKWVWDPWLTASNVHTGWVRPTGGV